MVASSQRSPSRRRIGSASVEELQRLVVALRVAVNEGEADQGLGLAGAVARGPEAPQGLAVGGDRHSSVSAFSPACSRPASGRGRRPGCPPLDDGRPRSPDASSRASPRNALRRFGVEGGHLQQMSSRHRGDREELLRSLRPGRAVDLEDQAIGGIVELELDVDAALVDHHADELVGRQLETVGVNLAARQPPLPGLARLEVDLERPGRRRDLESGRRSLGAGAGGRLAAGRRRQRQAEGNRQDGPARSLRAPSGPHTPRSARRSRRRGPGAAPGTRRGAGSRAAARE